MLSFQHESTRQAKIYEGMVYGWECSSVVQHITRRGHYKLSLGSPNIFKTTDKDFKSVVLSMFKNTKVNHVQKPKV